MGYGYALRGEVVPGDKIGRQIGFPTANLALEDARKLLPASGVYAVWVSVGEEHYGGMLNIGVRPTVSCTGMTRIVSCTGMTRIEVHIFDFHRDIYGQKIRVELVAHIRGEQKFDGIAELATQLQRDKKAVEACLHGSRVA